MKPTMANRICWIIFGVGLLVAFVGLLSYEVFCFAGVVIIMAAVVFRMIFFRCPYCGTYLDRGNPTYCPKCGEKVNE